MTTRNSKGSVSLPQRQRRIGSASKAMKDDVDCCLRCHQDSVVRCRQDTNTCRYKYCHSSPNHCRIVSSDWCSSRIGIMKCNKNNSIVSCIRSLLSKIHSVSYPPKFKPMTLVTFQLQRNSILTVSDSSVYPLTTIIIVTIILLCIGIPTFSTVHGWTSSSSSFYDGALKKHYRLLNHPFRRFEFVPPHGSILPTRHLHTRTILHSTKSDPSNQEPIVTVPTTTTITSTTTTSSTTTSSTDSFNPTLSIISTTITSMSTVADAQRKIRPPKRMESPLGVRRRVKAVLDRARNRTRRMDERMVNPNGSFPNTTTTTIPTTVIPSDRVSDSDVRSLSPIQNKRTFTTTQNIDSLPLEKTRDTIPQMEDRPNMIRSDKSNTSTTMNMITSSNPPPVSSLKNPTETRETAVTSSNSVPNNLPSLAPKEPLPFRLPNLSPQQRAALDQGERIQVQENMGRQGYGFVVVDVKASVDVVWDCLLDFYSYPETIPTVRQVQMLTNTHLSQDYHSESELSTEEIRKLYEDGTYATLKHGVASVTRAVFTLSKFQLKIAAIHKYRPHPDGDYMIFTLDPACTNVVLQMAKGTWHTQPNPDGKGMGITRVWLLCELRVSPLLPQFITDYAASRAMPRATTWIKPHVEAAANLWLKR